MLPPVGNLRRDGVDEVERIEIEVLGSGARVGLAPA